MSKTIMGACVARPAHEPWPLFQGPLRLTEGLATRSATLQFQLAQPSERRVRKARVSNAARTGMPRASKRKIKSVATAHCCGPQGGPSGAQPQNAHVRENKTLELVLFLCLSQNGNLLFPPPEPNNCCGKPGYNRPISSFFSFFFFFFSRGSFLRSPKR